jgi:hypothetical protein
MYTYDEYKLKSCSAEADTWTVIMCGDEAPDWARPWYLNTADPELACKPTSFIHGFKRCHRLGSTKTEDKDKQQSYCALHD